MFILRADAVCDVCLDPYSEDKSPAVIRCGHVFCRPCLHTLAARNCPICRAYFTPAEITRVHVDFQPGISTPLPVVERPGEEVYLEHQAVASAKTGDVRQMATVLARLKLKLSSISLPSTQPPAIRAVADLLQLLMEATTQLNDALEQFSGEERRNTLQSRIREHEWEMAKRELLRERGTLREQLEHQKSLHTLAEEKLRRLQAATTTASPAMPAPAAVRPPTPQRATSPSWLPTLPPVVTVSTIPITFPGLFPKRSGTPEPSEIKPPSRPATAEHTEPVASLQPITNLPFSSVSPFEVVSKRRVRPATADSATTVTNRDTTGSAFAPPASQAATLVASPGENASRSRTVLRGPRAQSASTLPPPRILPIGPTTKTHTDTSTSTSTSRSPTPAATAQSDREAALQALTSAVTLLSSPQRHSVQPTSNQRRWGSKSGASHPPSSMPNLMPAPPRRESLPTVTQRTASLTSSTPRPVLTSLTPRPALTSSTPRQALTSSTPRQAQPQSQPQSQSQSAVHHVRPPRSQRPTSPPPSFPEGLLARRTALRRSSREIVI